MPESVTAVEACSGCDRLIAATTRCSCCERPVCRDCARVSAGVVWCDACIDDSWDLYPDELAALNPNVNTKEQL